MNAHDQDSTRCARCDGEIIDALGVFTRTKDYCSMKCATPVFAVGDGVAMCYLNDVYPGTVRRISKSGHMLWVSEDRIAKGHFDESFGPQADLYEPRDVPESEWRCFTRRADGRYREKGHTSPVLSEGRGYNRPREI